MIRPICMTLALAAASPLTAQEAGGTDGVSTAEATVTEVPLIRDGRDADLDAFKWTARPIVVFADSAEDPAYQRQIALLNARADDLRERDVVVLVDTHPEDRSALRLKLRPRGFMLALIGKDGGVKLRKPLPWDVREISRVIDKMPMRQQEVRDRRGGS